MRRYGEVPHPLVIAPDWDTPATYCAGARVTLLVTLIGRAIQYLPFVAHAFERAARKGIGEQRHQLHAESIETESAPGTEDWHPVAPDQPVERS